MKFKEYNQEQPWLIPPDIEEEIPSHDLCRIINEVVDAIDTRKLEDRYNEEGNTAYHPKMMIKVLFYSYARRVFSSRKIAEELERNIYYWYLSGKQRPDFRTICAFRARHIEDLKEIFIEIVKLCIELGLSEVSTAIIDGTKIKANSNKDKFRDSKWLDKKISEESKFIEDALKESERVDIEEDTKYGKDKRGDEISEEIRDREKRLKRLKELKKELEERKLNRINETDTGSKVMKSQGKFISAYNCQVVADKKSQVILMADVVDSENDCYQVKPNVERLKESFNKKPRVLIADTGYCEGESLKYLSDENIEGVIPDKHISEIKAELDGDVPEDKKFKKDQFTYDKEKDEYICPEEKELKKMYSKPSIAKRKDGREIKLIQYEGTECKDCNSKPRCTRGKANRRITRYEDEYLREEMASKIRSDRGYELYKLRMKVVEPIFGNIKHNIGFRNFSMRGLAKTRGEFYILAAVHNILKLKKHLENMNYMTLGRIFIFSM